MKTRTGFRTHLRMENGLCILHTRLTKTEPFIREAGQTKAYEY